MFVERVRVTKRAFPPKKKSEWKMKFYSYQECLLGGLCGIEVFEEGIVSGGEDGE